MGGLSAYDRETLEIQAGIEAVKSLADQAATEMHAAEDRLRRNRAEEVRLEKLLLAHLKTPDPSRPASGGVNIAARDREF